jgi:hypothetical protein
VILLSESKYEKDGTLIWKTVSTNKWLNIETLSVNEVIFNKVCVVSELDSFVNKNSVSLNNRKDLLAEIFVAKAKIYSLPSEQAEIIDEAQFGERLKIVGVFKDEPWYEVFDRKTGKKGWIHFNTFSIVTTKTPLPPIEISFALKSSIITVEKKFTLEIIGNNIPPNSTITFNGISLPTIYVSPNSIKADVPSKLYAVEGKAFVKVITPNRIQKKHSLIIIDIKNPPNPPFEYVGLVSRQRANNDTAYLLAKNSKDPPIGVRLNDTVGGKYRVIAISSKEVVLRDKELGFEYSLPLIRRTTTQSNPNNPQVPIQQIGPNGQPCPPGIPCKILPKPEDKKQELEADEDEDGKH